MKLKLIATLACVSLAMAACANKDSYRSAISGSGSGSGGNGGETLTQSEQAAIDKVSIDSTYTSLSETQQSLELKEGVQGVQVDLHPVETENHTVPGMLNLQLVILDRSSENCSPRQINIPSFRESDLLNGQIRVNGVGRVVCLDSSNCNDALLYIESTEEGVVSAITAVRLTKDENNVFRPAQNESDVFANAQSIEEAVRQCLEAKASTSATSETTSDTTAAPAETSVSPGVDVEQVRLVELTRQIRSLESQIRNNAPAMATSANELRARLAALKSERSDLIRRRQTRAYQASRAAQGNGSQAQAIDPLANFEEPAAQSTSPKFGPQ